MELDRTQAVPAALVRQSNARTIALLRLVVAIGVIALSVVWFTKGDRVVRQVSIATTVVNVALALALLFDFRRPERISAWKLLVFGVMCAIEVLAVAWYIGPFSPAVTAFFVGVFLFGLGDSERNGWVVYLTCALGYLGLSTLSISGLLPYEAPSLPLASPDRVTLIVVAGIVQALLAATFWLARSSRQATMLALVELEQAAKRIHQRDALLHEARADLREVIEAGRVGRYTGRRVGAYAIGDVIGRGASGEVYRALGDDGRSVAVKFLHAGATAKEAVVARFFREAEIASSLASDHIPAVYASGIAEGGEPYLAMELLNGEDLAAHLRKKKRLGLTETLEMVEQVASALAKTQEAGIVHRDLKPLNLFLAEEHAGRRRWKVLDFGTSKLVGTGNTLTQGEPIGTPGYMAPEQAQGHQVEHRADVFSLAAVAYRALTGRPPFTGDNPVATLYRVVHEAPPRPGELVSLPIDVDRVLALALAKAPERRLASAALFAASLRDAALGQLDERLRRDADGLATEQPWAVRSEPDELDDGSR